MKQRDLWVSKKHENTPNPSSQLVILAILLVPHEITVAPPCLSDSPARNASPLSWICKISYQPPPRCDFTHCSLVFPLLEQLSTQILRFAPFRHPKVRASGAVGGVSLKTTAAELAQPHSAFGCSLRLCECRYRGIRCVAMDPVAACVNVSCGACAVRFFPLPKAPALGLASGGQRVAAIERRKTVQ